MQIRKKITSFVLSTMFLAIVCVAALAQTTPSEIERRTTDAQARVAEAQARAAEAQARTAEANTRRNEIANRQSEIDLLSATTSVSGDLIENDISAYKAVSCAASDINQQLRSIGTRVDLLMIYSPRFAKTMAEYAVMISQLERLKDRYERIFNMPQAIRTIDDPERVNKVGDLASILNPAEQFSSLAIDTLALFKTEVDIQGKTIVIGKDEFLAKLLNGIDLEVYYPEKMIPMNLNDSRLLSVLSDLAEDRVKSEYILQNKFDISEYNRKRIAPVLSALNATYDNLIGQFFPSSGSGQESQAAEKADRLKSVDFKLGLRSIVEFMRAELASGVMNAKDQKRKYWLDVHVTKAASNQRNKSSAIVDIFTGGQRLSFSGGSIVNYRIFSSDGRVIASDTILTYIPYKRSKKIADYKCQRVSYLP